MQLLCQVLFPSTITRRHFHNANYTEQADSSNNVSDFYPEDG
jgi:hypothetical protein